MRILCLKTVMAIDMKKLLLIFASLLLSACSSARMSDLVGLRTKEICTEEYHLLNIHANISNDIGVVRKVTEKRSEDTVTLDIEYGLMPVSQGTSMVDVYVNLEDGVRRVILPDGKELWSSSDKKVCKSDQVSKEGEFNGIEK
jgi:hypothetical protein